MTQYSSLQIWYENLLETLKGLKIHKTMRTVNIYASFWFIYLILGLPHFFMHCFGLQSLFYTVFVFLKQVNGSIIKKTTTKEPLSPPLLALWCPLWLGGVLTSLAFKGGGQLCQWTQYVSNQTKVRSSYINTELSCVRFAVRSSREQVTCDAKHIDLLLKCWKRHGVSSLCIVLGHVGASVAAD